MAIVYKILFEVKLLHEFYMTNYDGTNIFENTPVNREAFLLKKFSSAQRNITGDVSFEVPLNAQKIFKNYHLKLLNTYSGYRVAIAVKPVKLSTGKTGYKPLAALPPDLNIPVLIEKKDNFINTYTKTRLNKVIDAVPFFF